MHTHNSLNKYSYSSYSLEETSSQHARLSQESRLKLPVLFTEDSTQL